MKKVGVLRKDAILILSIEDEVIEFRLKNDIFVEFDKEAPLLDKIKVIDGSKRKAPFLRLVES